MTYTLYIAENCHQCAEVVNFMNDNKISYNSINVDLTNQQPPFKLFAFPALFNDETLLCYGTDIKSFLSEKVN
ncbi:MAG: hypothetical protein RJQ00_04440 [Vicingaceae bacterium]